MVGRDTSALSSAALAICGTAVQILEKCVPAPGDAALIVGAGLAPVLGPVAVAAGAVAGLGANRLASALDRRADARRAARDLLLNHDIAHAQGAAVAARIREVRRESGCIHLRTRMRLERLARRAPDWWADVVRPKVDARTKLWLEGAKDEELVDVLMELLAGDREPQRKRAAWLLVIQEAEIAVLNGKRLDPDTRGRLAAALDESFVADTFEAIKSEPKATASATLRFLAEILAELRHDRSAAAAPEWVELLEEAAVKLSVAAAALEAVGALPAELRALTEEVCQATAAARKAESESRMAREASHEARDAARATHALVSERLLLRSTRVPCQLPPLPQHFHGRERERARLLDLLRDEQPSCYVVGPPGMGKTALAASLIAELVGPRGERIAASPFPDGTVFIDVYRLKGVPDAVFAALVEALEPDLLAERGDAAGSARRACASRRMLVVFEGAEELGEALPDVLAVFDATSKRIVLTRDRGQVVPGRAVDVKDALSETEALALLETLAPEVGGDLRRRVQARLGGHPYALTMAGAQLGRGDEAPAAFVAALERPGVPVLTEAGDARRTLDWLFERSFRRLEPDARALLVGFGVLAAGPVSLRTIYALLDTLDELRARSAIKRLVQQSWARLVMQSSGSEELEAWQLAHIVSYQFARQQDDDGVVERARARARDDLLGALRDPAASAPGSVRLAVEHAVAALSRAVAWSESDRLLNTILYDASERLITVGLLPYSRLTIEAVGEALDRVPDARRSHGWQREWSVFLDKLGDVQVAQGDLARAGGSYEASKKIAEKLVESDPSNAAWQRDLSVSLDNLGNVRLAQGDLARAGGSYEASKRIREKLVESDPSNAEWQRDLSVSLNKLGNVQLAQGDLARAGGSYEASKRIREKLVESDPSNAEWQRDLSVSLNKLGNVQLAQGDLARAGGSYEASKKIAEKLVESDPSNAAWQRDLSVSSNKLGDVRLAQGDLARAGGSYEASKRIREKLVESDPSNAAWQRDLSVSLDNLGNVRLAQGDLARAGGSYEASKRIREKLVESDPSNAAWQRDLSVSLDKLGNVQLAQGDLARAGGSYEASKKIAEKLVESDPSNAAWQRDLSVSLDNLGNVRLAQGDLARAGGSYEASKRIREKLVESDPSNAEWQRDLSVSSNKLGDVQLAQGDLARAGGSYEASKKIAEKLVESDPSNAAWQRDLSVSLDNLGNVRLAQGDLARAGGSYEASKRIREKLVESDPSNAAWQRDLSVSLDNLGNVRLAQGDLARAGGSYEASKRIREKLVESDPSNAEWQRDLSVSLNKLGNVQLAQGDLARAGGSYEASKKIAEKLVESDPSNAAWQRDLVVALAKLGDLARREGDRSQAQICYREALAIAQRLSDLDPTNTVWLSDLQKLRARLASA